MEHRRRTKARQQQRNGDREAEQRAAMKETARLASAVMVKAAWSHLKIVRPSDVQWFQWERHTCTLHNALQGHQADNKVAKIISQNDMNRVCFRDPCQACHSVINYVSYFLFCLVASHCKTASAQRRSVAIHVLWLCRHQHRSVPVSQFTISTCNWSDWHEHVYRPQCWRLLESDPQTKLRTFYSLLN